MTAAHYQQLAICLGLRLKIIAVDKAFVDARVGEVILLRCPLDGLQEWPAINFLALALLHAGSDPVYH